MFPSFGLFADINCPFSQPGFCERPHCLYKHATEMPVIFGASYSPSPVNYAGEPAVSPVIDESKHHSLQELERINKEIETVRHEVEQEQRRLSHYQTAHGDSINTAINFPVSKPGGKVDRDPYGLSSCTDFTKTFSPAKKYVVDNSKPRTDLEYDPLSNFSSGLRSYSSSSKEQKVKNRQGLKRERDTAPCHQKKPVAYVSLISNDDSVLIIDIPPSPDKKRARAQQPVDSVAGKLPQENVEELEEVKTVSILHLSNADECSTALPPALTIKENRANSGAENNLSESKERENVPVDWGVVESTVFLEDLQSENQNITLFQAAETVVEKHANPPATTDQQDHKWNNLIVEKEKNALPAEISQHEPPRSVKKMNNFPSQNSLFYNAPVVKSDSPCRHTKHVLTAEQNRVSSQWSSTQSVPSVLPHSQRTSSKMPAQIQGKAAAPESYLEPAEPASDSSQGPARHDLSASSWANKAESSSASAEQVIIISSSDDEFNHSDVSDSDPMEECYRIFMEANNEDKRDEEQSGVSIGAVDVEKPRLNVEPKVLSLKKRVAHEARYTEQQHEAKRRCQPQVLVPLRGPSLPGYASQRSIASKIQQVQQRAHMLTTSVKGGQASTSHTCQRKPETPSAPSTSAQSPENLQLAPEQNASMKCISLGTAVIGVNNNLHFILPEGTVPLPFISSTSTSASVLTPISQVPTSSVTVRQMFHPPAVIPVQRYRTTAPVLIPAPARKPSLTSASTSAHLSPAASSAAPQDAVQTPVKPVPTKRKSKQQSEAAIDKVPRDIRQRYVNMFTEEFLKTTANVNDAFDKALAEEKSVYNRSVNKLKYQTVAVNALKRLKNQSAVATKDENEVNSQRSKGNISLNLKNLKDDVAFYESMKDYILTEERLTENNYPVQHPEKPGCAVLFVDNKKSSADPLKRICCRCGATYSVNQMGKHIRKEECHYHYGKGVTKRVPGGVETRYSCCEGVMGAPGCQVFKLHVHDALSLDGFVSTVPRLPSDTSCPGVYSLDCEMCYTIHGLELSRVTVVNSSLQVIYDSFVRPDNEAIDYNTRFSGIGEEDVKGTLTSLRVVQETLLSFISADTILIGHGLETDLCALKLLHGTVVDTSVVFPHRLGPPHKLTLNNLTAEYLRRIIQQSVCDHDTAEDAAACMELMLWRVKEDGKLKKSWK